MFAKHYFLMFMAFSSSCAFAHGSSHPSCTQERTGKHFSYRAPGWEECRHDNYVYRIEQQRLCDASPQCVKKREKEALQREKNMTAFFLTMTVIFAALFALIFA